MKHSNLTQEIISCFYKVHTTLGYGFLEKVYQNAMLLELQRSGLQAESQKRINVFYLGCNVGEYFADVVVEDKVILELKASESLSKEHHYQLINYLKASNLEIGLLLNFGKKAELKRAIFTNDRKSHMVSNNTD